MKENRELVREKAETTEARLYCHIFKSLGLKERVELHSYDPPTHSGLHKSEFAILKFMNADEAHR